MAICANCKQSILIVAPDTGLCGACESLLSGSGRGRTRSTPTQAPARDKVAVARRSGSVGLLSAVAVVLVAIGLGYWLFNRQQIEHAYAEALSTCEVNTLRGSARINALDQMYGRDARPSSLAVSLAFCTLNGAIDDVERLRSLRP